MLGISGSFRGFEGDFVLLWFRVLEYIGPLEFGIRVLGLYP